MQVPMSGHSAMRLEGDAASFSGLATLCGSSPARGLGKDPARAHTTVQALLVGSRGMGGRRDHLGLLQPAVATRRVDTKERETEEDASDESKALQRTQ